ncbi:MAG: hypothetical protein V9E83_06605 [Baekduia sp.]
MLRIPTALVAGTGLIAGYAVAAGTGIRPLGGVVLVAACGWCARRWWSERGPLVAVALAALFTVAFVLSHPLGHAIGAWPAVLCVSAVVAAVTWIAGDRPAR